MHCALLLDRVRTVCVVLCVGRLYIVLGSLETTSGAKTSVCYMNMRACECERNININIYLAVCVYDVCALHLLHI